MPIDESEALLTVEFFLKRAMNKKMNLLRSRIFFSWWFGLGIPLFLAGMVVVAFCQSMTFGVITSILTALWIFDTFTTTCSRCQFYGTAKCGIPSLIVPLFLSKKSPFSISLLRIRFHYYADIGMILYVNFVYWRVPWLFPIVALCSFIGWLVIFQPKRFHGLLFRLNPARANHLPTVDHEQSKGLPTSLAATLGPGNTAAPRRSIRRANEDATPQSRPPDAARG